MKREFTPKQLKVLREVNPRVTDVLFNKILKDLNEDYSIMSDPDTIEFNAYAFSQVKWAMEDIKVVNASDLLNEARNYPLVQETEAKYRYFKRFIFTAEDDDCLNELASLFEKAFINVYRVYVDEETKKIAFAFWL